MTIPANLKYAKTHEWAKLEADGLISVGITHHAQDLLGDMVYVENPEVGQQLKAGQECAVVESVKAASDVYSPVAGEIVAVNSAVTESPEKINQDPYAAWMFKLKPASAQALDNLLSASQYEQLVASEQH